jgi:DUF438 domain-containing protein
MSEIIDNRTKRVATMKSIIKRLHTGAAPGEVKDDLARIVRETDATEIAEMEQQIIDEGTPVEEVRLMCDLHSQVLREITKNPGEKAVLPGHPVDTFRIENFALRNAAEKIRKLYRQVSEDSPAEVIEETRLAVLEAANKLADVDKHYKRKENLIFPYLEKHGVYGPSQVMWAKDDEARGLLRDFAAALKSGFASSADFLSNSESAAEPALSALEEMIHKEEQILLPMCLQKFSDEEWSEIFIESPKIGWCIVEPRRGYEPPQGEKAVVEKRSTMNEDFITFLTGSLTPQQLIGILSVIPFDLTFVDADDTVQYFSHREDSVFPRNTTVLGRKVQHCHPPKSVATVERILSDFRSGTRDVAEFWIEIQGRFVHIRYFAVRDPQGKYLGTLEVTQDATHIRALAGERRLLQYEK